MDEIERDAGCHMERCGVIDYKDLIGYDYDDDLDIFKDDFKDDIDDDIIGIDDLQDDNIHDGPQRDVDRG
jgi:hypothetical protein